MNIDYMFLFDRQRYIPVILNEIPIPLDIIYRDIILFLNWLVPIN